jgi:hypothetical protein
MGLEYSSECYCGTYLKGNAETSREAICDMQCSGDPTEICGGSNHLSLFRVPDYDTPAIPYRENYEYDGCYSERTNGRALGNASYVDPKGLTVASCEAFCEKNGFELYGLENGGECWCGDAIAEASVNVPDSECSRTCPGNYRDLACGDANRLSVWSRKTYM